MSFYQFLIKRLLYVVPTIFLVTVMVFSILHLIPGDPVDALLAEDQDAEMRKILIKQLGFDQPLHIAYESYFRQVVKLAKEGDFDILGHLDLVKRDAHKFGKSYDGPEPYSDMIRTALRA